MLNKIMERDTSCIILVFFVKIPDFSRSVLLLLTSNSAYVITNLLDLCLNI